MHAHLMSTSDNHTSYQCCRGTAWVFVPGSSWALNYGAICCNLCFLTTASILFSFSPVGFMHQPWPATGCIRSLVKLPKPKKKKKKNLTGFVLHHIVYFRCSLPALPHCQIKQRTWTKSGQFWLQLPGQHCWQGRRTKMTNSWFFWEFLANKQGRFCDPLKKIVWHFPLMTQWLTKVNKEKPPAAGFSVNSVVYRCGKTLALEKTVINVCGVLFPRNPGAQKNNVQQTKVRQTADIWHEMGTVAQARGISAKSANDLHTKTTHLGFSIKMPQLRALEPNISNIWA